MGSRVAKGAGQKRQTKGTAAKKRAVSKADAVPAPAPETPKPEKRPVGRPLKYRREFCDEVVTHGAEGMGKAEIAYELGVVRSTLDDWVEKYPEFSGAMDRAREASLAWWARLGRTGILLGSKGFNAQAYQFQARNRFPDDWKADPTIDLGNSSLTVQIVRYGDKPKGGA